MKKKHLVRVVPYAFLLPAVLLLFSFLLIPLINTVSYSFQNYILTKPQSRGFVGLGNFVEMLSKDRYFYQILGVTAKWVFFTVSLQLLLGLSAALILNEPMKSRSVFRALFFLPWAVSGILTSQMFALMYNEHMGLINVFLKMIGVIEKPIAFTGATSLVFASVVVAEVWRGFPFFVIILLAALQSISGDVIEAARVDGAGKCRMLWYVVLPHIRETILFATILRIIWEFNSVDVIYNITGGGPANMTMTLSMYIVRTASRLGNYGYASALTVVALIIMLLLVSFYLKLGDSETEVQ